MGGRSRRRVGWGEWGVSAHLISGISQVLTMGLMSIGTQDKRLSPRRSGMTVYTQC